MVTVACSDPSGSTRRCSGRSPAVTVRPAVATGTRAGGTARRPPETVTPGPSRSWSMVPGTRFIPGLPRKRATKVLAGSA